MIEVWGSWAKMTVKNAFHSSLSTPIYLNSLLKHHLSNREERYKINGPIKTNRVGEE